MAQKKISRNDPCPCGSGKKFKHCCISKDIDWSARTTPARRPQLPPLPDAVSQAFHGPFHIVDTKLKSIAKTHPDGAAWKGLVERLTEATPAADRMRAYKVVREARVIPEEAAEYLFLWAIQWMPAESRPASPEPEEEEDLDEEADHQELDRETLAQLRKFGVDDLAEMFVSNRREFDRRHERGRQFFFGPPDEVLARHLKAKGIID
jgi:hypothetical protein